MSFIPDSTDDTIEGSKTIRDSILNQDPFKDLYYATCELFDPDKSLNDNFIAFLKETKKVRHTKLFGIYCDAVRATVLWLKQRENDEKGISIDLLTVLQPFHDDIDSQWTMDTHYLILHNLDAWFFGFKNTTYGFLKYSGVCRKYVNNNVKAGIFQSYSYCPGKSITIMETGIATVGWLDFNDQDMEKVIEEQKEHECAQTDYIRMVAKLLDEHNY